MQTAESLSPYDRLNALPEGLTGEILNGQLHAQPRPSGIHVGVQSALHSERSGPFDRGSGGPGGWRNLMEPEIHFVRDKEVCVPDLAGWRRERLPRLPKDQRFEVLPDWVCEILSPSTESKDRQIKMPIYCRYGVRFAWLIDPLKQTLEAFILDDADWKALGIWHGETSAAVSPFESVPFSVAGLWS